MIIKKPRKKFMKPLKMLDFSEVDTYAPSPEIK